MRTDCFNLFTGSKQLFVLICLYSHAVHGYTKQAVLRMSISHSTAKLRRDTYECNEMRVGLDGRFYKLESSDLR